MGGRAVGRNWSRSSAERVWGWVSQVYVDVDDNESVAMLQYSAGGSTVSSNAGRMHIVRAQAVELDWMWQRDKTDARGRQAEGKRAPNQQSRRRDAILSRAEGMGERG